MNIIKSPGRKLPLVVDMDCLIHDDIYIKRVHLIEYLSNDLPAAS